MKNRTKSTRLRLVVVGIMFAVAKEVLAYFSIPVTTETMITIEGLLLSLAGLDTFRPLAASHASAASDDAEPEEASGEAVDATD